MKTSEEILDKIEAAINALPNPRPNEVWSTRQLRALVIGGSRGIGRSLVTLLQEMGWEVEAPSSQKLNLWEPDFEWDLSQRKPFDFVCFCAGDLQPFPWDRKFGDDYVDSYWIHALGPVLLLAQNKGTAFPWWTTVCFVSSVGATNDGIVDLAYGMAKAAIDKAARALAEHEAWHVVLVRFDLVDTDTLYKLPTETLHGRPVLTARQAAEQIILECGL